MGKFHRMTVGGAEIVAIQDAWAKIPPAMFFPDREASAWEPYREFLDADGDLTVNVGAWLVRSQGRTILVDTGLGGRPTQFPLQEPTSLPSVLEAAGVKPADVEVVVYSHLHFDHTGWNTVDKAGKPELVFPNARHVVQRQEWEYWTSSDELKAGSQYANNLAPVEAAGLLDLVEGEHAVTSEFVTLPTPGHTPGHVSFVLASQGERAYLIGDAAHQPVQVTEPTWGIFADVDKETSAKSRVALMERIASEGALLASGHFPFPGLGRAVQKGGKRRFEPLS